MINWLAEKLDKFLVKIIKDVKPTTITPTITKPIQSYGTHVPLVSSLHPVFSCPICKKMSTVEDGKEVLFKPTKKLTKVCNNCYNVIQNHKGGK